jgi:hypothetical protein
MKLNELKVNKTSSIIIMIMIVALSLFGKVYSQDTITKAYKGKPSNVQTIEMLRDSIESYLYKRYGHTVKPDPSFLKGCIRSAYESAYDKDIEPEGKEAYFHSTVGSTIDILKNYTISELTDEFLDITEEPSMKNQFSLLNPVSYWVEIIELEGKYYMVVALG